MDIKKILKLNKKKPVEGGFVIDSSFGDTLPQNNEPQKIDIKTDVFDILFLQLLLICTSFRKNSIN